MNKRNYRTGIYKVTHKETGASYIGKGSRIEERWAKHIKLALSGDKTHFHSAIRKYGVDAFSWNIILQCDEYNNHLLCIMEKFFIKEYHTFFKDPEYVVGYNETPGGDGGALYGKALENMKNSLKSRPTWNKGISWDESTREKIREHRIGTHHSFETKEKIGNAHRGRKRSPETGQRISKALKGKPRFSMRGKPSGMSGKTQSEEARRKISVANTGKHSNKRHPLTEVEKEKRRAAYTPEVRQRMSDSHKGLPPNIGWHHSDAAKKKMSEAKKGRPATNLGVPRTDEMKANDRIIALKRYLNRGQPCIKCSHLNSHNEVEIHCFVSTNEVAIRLTGLTGAMTTVQHILDDPSWISPKPKSKAWQILKDWKIEYCSQFGLLDHRPELK
jgi:group I intron endonuclease